MMHQFNNISYRQWIAFGLATVQWFFATATEPFAYRGLRWYHTLVVSLAAFLLMKRPLVWRALGGFKWIYIAIATSWSIQLLAQHDVLYTGDRVFKSFVAIGTFVLLIPTLTHPMARKVLCFGIIYTAISRSSVIYNYLNYDIGSYEALSGFGKDKNFSGMLMAMGIAVLLTFSLSKKATIRLRLFSGGLATYLLYWIFSTGSRSAALVTMALLSAILFLHLVFTSSVASRLGSVALGIVIVIFSVSAIRSQLDNYEFLQKNYIELVEFSKGDREDINGRIELFHLAVAKIKDNPLIGSGYGSSMEYLRGRWMLTHNTYLAQWIEYGLFGVVSLLLFIGFVCREIKYQLSKMKYGQEQLFDCALSLSGVPLILMMATLDMSTITYLVICLYAAFECQRKLYGTHQ